jgi:hypothetical protein
MSLLFFSVAKSFRPSPRLAVSRRASYYVCLPLFQCVHNTASITAPVGGESLEKPVSVSRIRSGLVFRVSTGSGLYHRHGRGVRCCIAWSRAARPRRAAWELLRNSSPVHASRSVGDPRNLVRLAAVLQSAVDGAVSRRGTRRKSHCRAGPTMALRAQKEGGCAVAHPPGELACSRKLTDDAQHAFVPAARAASS